MAYTDKVFHTFPKVDLWKQKWPVLKQIQTNTIFKGQMSSSDICFETPSLKQSSRVKCPLPKDPERGRWECNSLQESCFRWNIFDDFFLYFLIQGGITVCNLQCNMVNLNNNHILHLYISFREAVYFGFSEKVGLFSRQDGQIQNPPAQETKFLNWTKSDHYLVWFPNPLAAFFKSDGDPV